MKYNNESNNISEWTTKKLKDEYKEYHQRIYQIKCYGTTDIRIFDAIGNELENRGVSINLSPIFN